MYGEFGVPADTHQQSQDPEKAYPIQWVGVNFIWQDQPPPAACLTQPGRRRRLDRAVTVPTPSLPLAGLLQWSYR